MFLGYKQVGKKFLLSNMKSAIVTSSVGEAFLLRNSEWFCVQQRPLTLDCKSAFQYHGRATEIMLQLTFPNQPKKPKGILNNELPPQIYSKHFIRNKSIAHILYKNYPPRVEERENFPTVPVTPSATNS